MKVLVVFDHPRRDSFCGAVADSLMAGLRSAGHVPELANLRAEGFDQGAGDRGGTLVAEMFDD